MRITAPHPCNFANQCDETYATNGYQAIDGYDLATGWGSPQCGLITQLASPTPAPGTPSITVGAVGTTHGGPHICISGQDFTPGGTVTIRYENLPESPGTKVVTTTQSVAADGTLSLNDNEKAFVAEAVAAGIPGCTPDVMAGGLVTVIAVDHASGVTASNTMPASYWCAVNQTTPFGGGCSVPPPVTIRYKQYGACRGFLTDLGNSVLEPNYAYVAFTVSGIENGSSQVFHFDPDRLYVDQGGTKRYADSTVHAQFWQYILGPWAISPGTYAVGETASLADAELGVVVSTTSTNAAQEAGTTPYALEYHDLPTDPEVVLANTTPTQTVWPYAGDCCDIGLVTCM